MGEWEERLKVAKNALQILKNDQDRDLYADAAIAFLESYSKAIKEVRKLTPSGNRTIYASALENALCDAVKKIRPLCVKQPLMEINAEKKHFDLLISKEGSESAAVVMEVKGNANDFDNVASGLMEFSLARRHHALIKKGKKEWKANKTHFILFCTYGDNKGWFDLMVSHLFDSEPPQTKPVLFSIFGKGTSPKKSEVVAKDLRVIFRTIYKNTR